LTETQTIGFVGLGAIGGPLSSALLEDGYPLAVFDLNDEAMRPLVERGAIACTSPAKVADIATTVLVSLPTPSTVHEVACGDNGLICGKKIRTFVDLSTTGSRVAQDIASSFADARIDHVDAPLSGGVAGANARSLTAMIAGDREACEGVRPLLESFSKNIVWVGEAPGHAQIAKLLNNLLSATALLITAEATTFGKSAGLDPQALLEIFNSSSGRNSATLEKFPQQILTRRFASGFRLELMRKDVTLCLEEAREQNFPMLLASVVQQLWTLGAAHAGDQADHTEIVRLFEDWTGQTIAGSTPAHDFR
jgi:3-hydroxyisobutyrate dehydrogenase-like beta-hydroxyacid dehydrogenase